MVLLFALLLLAPPETAKFTGRLWQAIRPVYAKTLEHPFLRGLTDGTLPRSRFQFYLQQDGEYLRAFGQALNVLAAKAPREDWSAALSRHAVEAVKAERELHESILKSYGVPPGRVAMAPVNYAYTNHLLATVHRGTFAEGLAAMLPCYWVYLEVGQELKRRGSSNPDYQRWIDQYSSPGYEKTVAEVLEMMNSESVKLSPEARRRLEDLFVISARYEWMFWDMAWREEKWPP